MFYASICCPWYSYAECSVRHTCVVQLCKYCNEYQVSHSIGSWLIGPDSSVDKSLCKIKEKTREIV